MRDRPILQALGLASLVLALTLPGLGARDLWAPNEATHAEAAREMVVDGHWLVPHINARPYLEKPPLLHWLIAGSWTARGAVLEGWARLPSVLGGLLGVLAVWGLGRRLYGTTVGLWAGLILATAGGWLWRARWIEPDSLLAGLSTVAVWAALEGWRASSSRTVFLLLAGAGLASGFALLTKGPVLFLFLLPPLLVLIAHGPYRSASRWLGLAAGTILLLLVPLTWVALATAFADYDLGAVLHRQVVVRGGEGLHHIRPFWYYLETSALETLPWSLLLPGGLWLAGRSAFSTRRSGFKDRFVLAWFAVPLLILSLIPEKRSVYLLPLYPALALLAGRLVVVVREGAASRRWVHWPLVAGALLIGLLAAALPWVASRELPGALLEASIAGGLLGLAALGGFFAGFRSLRLGWILLGGLTGIGIAAAAWGAGALDAEKSARGFAHHAYTAAQEEMVWFYGTPRPGIHFYAGRTGPLAESLDTLREEASREGGILLVVNAEDLGRLRDGGVEIQVLIEEEVGEKTLLLARITTPADHGTGHDTIDPS